jgi:hypothetical protein
MARCTTQGYHGGDGSWRLDERVAIRARLEHFGRSNREDPLVKQRGLVGRSRQGAWPLYGFSTRMRWASLSAT